MCSQFHVEYTRGRHRHFPKNFFCARAESSTAGSVSLSDWLARTKNLFNRDKVSDLFPIGFGLHDGENKQAIFFLK